MKNIKKLKQWVTWNCETKNKKRPYKVNRRTPADTTDPKTWGSYKDAKAHGNDVGLVITEGLVFLDLDHVLHKGKLVDWAEKLIKKLKPKYIEISPSRDGLHIIVKGKWDSSLRNKIKLNHGEALEVYGTERYSTITENPYKDSPMKVKKCDLTYLKDFIGKATSSKKDKTHIVSGKTFKEVKKSLQSLGQWSKPKDAQGDEWKSEDDCKFMHRIADSIGCADAVLIGEVFSRSKVARDKVVDRIDYHVSRIIQDHEFLIEQFEVFDDIPALPKPSVIDKVKTRLQEASKQGKNAVTKEMKKLGRHRLTLGAQSFNEFWEKGDIVIDLLRKIPLAF